MAPGGQQAGDSNWYKIPRNSESLGRITAGRSTSRFLFPLRCQQCGFKLYLLLSQLQILALAEPMS